ncbi:LADA_0G13476g1_1 [Lachancea dasiensis]|uniref:LADA_0G13476g1_1 n=1 Tax=Lachancea dasiensis TaxID=1072105 RepID=A0A1G4JW19_9SACH|nr:LADA_0G13476g1_1 [Lachancea dasiensis]
MSSSSVPTTSKFTSNLLSFSSLKETSSSSPLLSSSLEKSSGFSSKSYGLISNPSSSTNSKEALSSDPPKSSSWAGLSSSSSKSYKLTGSPSLSSRSATTYSSPSSKRLKKTASSSMSLSSLPSSLTTSSSSSLSFSSSSKKFGSSSSASLEGVSDTSVRPSSMATYKLTLSSDYKLSTSSSSKSISTKSSQSESKLGGSPNPSFDSSFESTSDSSSKQSASSTSVKSPTSLSSTYFLSVASSGTPSASSAVDDGARTTEDADKSSSIAQYPIITISAAATSKSSNGYISSSFSSHFGKQSSMAVSAELSSRYPTKESYEPGTTQSASTIDTSLGSNSPLTYSSFSVDKTSSFQSTLSQESRSLFSASTENPTQSSVTSSTSLHSLSRTITTADFSARNSFSSQLSDISLTKSIVSTDTGSESLEPFSTGYFTQGNQISGIFVGLNRASISSSTESSTSGLTDTVSSRPTDSSASGLTDTVSPRPTDSSALGLTDTVSPRPTDSSALGLTDTVSSRPTDSKATTSSTSSAHEQSLTSQSFAFAAIDSSSFASSGTSDRSPSGSQPSGSGHYRSTVMSSGMKSYASLSSADYSTPMSSELSKSSTFRNSFSESTTNIMSDKASSLSGSGYMTASAVESKTSISNSISSFKLVSSSRSIQSAERKTQSPTTTETPVYSSTGKGTRSASTAPAPDEQAILTSSSGIVSSVVKASSETGATGTIAKQPSTSSSMISDFQTSIPTTLDSSAPGSTTSSSDAALQSIKSSEPEPNRRTSSYSISGQESRSAESAVISTANSMSVTPESSMKQSSTTANQQTSLTSFPDKISSSITEGTAITQSRITSNSESTSQASFQFRPTEGSSLPSSGTSTRATTSFTTGHSSSLATNVPQDSQTSRSTTSIPRSVSFLGHTDSSFSTSKVSEIMSDYSPVSSHSVITTSTSNTMGNAVSASISPSSTIASSVSTSTTDTRTMHSVSLLSVTQGSTERTSSDYTSSFTSMREFATSTGLSFSHDSSLRPLVSTEISLTSEASRSLLATGTPSKSSSDSTMPFASAVPSSEIGDRISKKSSESATIITMASALLTSNSAETHHISISSTGSSAKGSLHSIAAPTSDATLQSTSRPISASTISSTPAIVDFSSASVKNTHSTGSIPQEGLSKTNSFPSSPLSDVVNTYMSSQMTTSPTKVLSTTAITNSLELSTNAASHSTAINPSLSGSDSPSKATLSPLLSTSGTSLISNGQNSQYSSTSYWLPSNILTESPSDQGSTASEASFDASATATLPQVILPPTAVPKPDNYSVITIGFKRELNYPFLINNPLASAQIFSFLPNILKYPFVTLRSHLNMTSHITKKRSLDGVLVDSQNLVTSGNYSQHTDRSRLFDALESNFSEITVNSIMPLIVSGDSYISSVAVVYFPSSAVELLQHMVLNNASGIYKNPDASLKSLALLIDPTIPLTGLINSQDSGSGESSGDGGASSSSSPGSGAAGNSKGNNHEGDSGSGALNAYNLFTINFKCAKRIIILLPVFLIFLSSWILVSLFMFGRLSKVKPVYGNLNALKKKWNVDKDAVAAYFMAPQCIDSQSYRDLEKYPFAPQGQFDDSSSENYDDDLLPVGDNMIFSQSTGLCYHLDSDGNFFYAGAHNNTSKGNLAQTLQNSDINDVTSVDHSANNAVNSALVIGLHENSDVDDELSVDEDGNVELSVLEFEPLSVDAHNTDTFESYNNQQYYKLNQYLQNLSGDDIAVTHSLPEGLKEEHGSSSNGDTSQAPHSSESSNLLGQLSAEDENLEDYFYSDDANTAHVGIEAPMSLNIRGNANNERHDKRDLEYDYVDDSNDVEDLNFDFNYSDEDNDQDDEVNDVHVGDFDELDEMMYRRLSSVSGVTGMIGGTSSSNESRIGLPMHNSGTVLSSFEKSRTISTTSEDAWRKSSFITSQSTPPTNTTDNFDQGRLSKEHVPPARPPRPASVISLDNEKTSLDWRLTEQASKNEKANAVREDLSRENIHWEADESSLTHIASEGENASFARNRQNGPQSNRLSRIEKSKRASFRQSVAFTLQSANIFSGSGRKRSHTTHEVGSHGHTKEELHKLKISGPIFSENSLGWGEI